MSRLVVGVELNDLVSFVDEVHKKTKYNEDTGLPYEKEISVAICKLGNKNFNCDDLIEFTERWDEEEFGMFSDFSRSIVI